MHPLNEWIKCCDRLPELFDFVLVFADNKGTGEPKPISIARWEGDKWIFLGTLEEGAWMDIEYSMETEDITHWMKFPSLP